MESFNHGLRNGATNPMSQARVLWQKGFAAVSLGEFNGQELLKTRLDRSPPGRQSYAPPIHFVGAWLRFFRAAAVDLSTRRDSRGDDCESLDVPAIPPSQIAFRDNARLLLRALRRCALGCVRRNPHEIGGGLALRAASR